MAEKHPSISWFEKQAKQIRRETSERIAGEGFSQELNLSAFSHYDLYHDKLPLPSGRAALAFNDIVTETALRKHVLTKDDPYLVTFLGSKVIEQSFYQFFDPTAPDRPIKNLSVAKHYGIFFTPPPIAEAMVAGLKARGKNTILVDPCLGSGVLLCASLLFSSECFYERLVGVELDEQLSGWARLILERVAELTGYQGVVDVFSGDGLSYLLEKINVSAEDTNIIINPPYGRIRLTLDRTTNAETILRSDCIDAVDSIENLQFSLANYARQLRKNLIFSEETGILEHSRLFFRACAELSLKGSSISIISPDSWMSGRDGKSLRNTLLSNRLIEKIILVREDSSKFATVNQSTAITFLNKNNRDNFSIRYLSEKEKEIEVLKYSMLKSVGCEDLAIPRVSGIYLEIFKKLSMLDDFGSLDWLTNARGEVDQTSLKHLFSLKKTKVPLVRGEHVGRFSFSHASSPEKPSFLLEESFAEFINGKPKHPHFNAPRIVGRQCSYAQQARRLIFCQVPEAHAVGNSCNYIHIKAKTQAEAAEKRCLLLGLLNSAVFDWYFKVKNSNNHVGNYEIDSFPYPTNIKYFPIIISVAHQLEEYAGTVGCNTEWLVDLLEAVVGLSFNLDPETEIQAILNQVGGCNIINAVNYAKHLKRGVLPQAPGISGIFFNHLEPTLSELDRLIISHVPEGGNWQNIPTCVPSERLKQIREMTAERGVVRTTYYGRLRRDQPAYTINTYFNRPGNGTHIHPILDRTLTCREAARLQGFPDKYIFLGSEGAIRNQIGNAVPPLLSAAIGEKFIQYAQSGLCVEIFCGAGGLSLGLEKAGWEIIGAIDNNRDALETYCFNRPCDLEPDTYRAGNTSVFRRDLQDVKAFEDVIPRLYQALNGRELDILVGGPPCQGFSHAGFRLNNDERNDLASIYLHFAERLRPRIFLLENVEGLVTFNKGQVLRDICNTLKEMGYRIYEPIWKLCAEEYGAPQMRRRVFVVATIDPAVDLSPPLPSHLKCAGRRANRVLPSLFSSNLLPPNTVSDALSGLSLPLRPASDLTRWLTGQGI